MTICLTIIAACAVVGVLVALYVLGETVKKCNGWHDRFVEANDSYVRTERRKDELIRKNRELGETNTRLNNDNGQLNKRLRDLETCTIWGVRINERDGASQLINYINQNYVARDLAIASTPNFAGITYGESFFAPATPTVDATSPEKLAAALVKLQDEELEAARGAYYRLQKKAEKHLSAEQSGAGPLFSASKSKVAAKAVEFVVASEVAGTDGDLGTVKAWLAKHPGETEKLAA